MPEMHPPAPDLPIVDVLDTLIDTGVVVKGEAVISVAGVDLIYLNLEVLLASLLAAEGTTGDGSAYESPRGAPPSSTTR